MIESYTCQEPNSLENGDFGWSWRNLESAKNLHWLHEWQKQKETCTVNLRIPLHMVYLNLTLSSARQ